MNKFCPQCGTHTDTGFNCPKGCKTAAFTLPPGKVLCDFEPVRYMCPDHGDTSAVDRVGWIPLYAAAKGE